MREHMGLYRGKRLDNGEWVRGYLVRSYYKTNDTCIGCPIELAVISVDPDTVDECTGLTDKNGKLIFEGDIFHLEDELVTVVIFKDGCFRLETYGLCGTYTESGYDACGGGWGIVDCEYVDWYYVHDMEIIGNIHDNPELLKGGEG
jgi:uncharacterized phage protein (TIGR01671 family)